MESARSSSSYDTIYDEWHQQYYWQNTLTPSGWATIDIFDVMVVIRNWGRTQ